MQSIVDYSLIFLKEIDLSLYINYKFRFVCQSYPTSDTMTPERAEAVKILQKPENKKYLKPTEWTSGSLLPSSGSAYSSNYQFRSPIFQTSEHIKSISCTADFNMYIMAWYRYGTYKGFWRSDLQEFTTDTSQYTTVNYINLQDLKYSDLKFAIVCQRADHSTSITAEEVASKVCIITDYHQNFVRVPVPDTKVAGRYKLIATYDDNGQFSYTWQPENNT